MPQTTENINGSSELQDTGETVRLEEQSQDLPSTFRSPTTAPESLNEVRPEVYNLNEFPNAVSDDILPDNTQFTMCAPSADSIEPEPEHSNVGPEPENSDIIVPINSAPTDCYWLMLSDLPSRLVFDV
ncbi:hypothetical protein K2173_000409 [Erythroxylum novogranatense]|uniref:Uncharacterized protein n=1 Tax=Erythroxylum novogranatense TaxID=1862640 RepID=A0AAV8SXE8_9ROSI|nr:hypothetical protein K2173_000409 [Erythroxylum novogranatense]